MTSYFWISILKLERQHLHKERLSIGAISGTCIAFVVELIAGEKLGGVAKGAVLGATTGIASGAIAAIAVAIIQNITVPAITKMCTDWEIKVIIVNATIGAFIGGIFGGYFTSNIVTGSLVALAFPTVTTVMHTAPLYAERRHRFKRVRRVPLTRVMNRNEIFNKQRSTE